MSLICYSKGVFSCYILEAVITRAVQHNEHTKECKNILMPKPVKNQMSKLLFLMQAGQDPVCTFKIV